jgi:flagellar M-ring protein FliF
VDKVDQRIRDLEDIAQRLQEYWHGQSLLGRLLVFGLPLLLIVGAVAAISMFVSAPPKPAALFRNLETSDAAAVVTELKKQKVDYTLENDGRDVMVPADQVYNLRLGLAGIGLPRGNVGFELFDKTKMGLTETGMKIDYQRALQGELAKTLESLGPVESASVLLNIAPDTSFLDSSARSTAAVTLHMRGGGSLGGAQVRGVQYLVSRAVSKLAPEDVTVVDGNGSSLTGDAASGSSGGAASGLDQAEKQRQIRKGIERDMEEKIRSVLEGPYGAGNLAVSVAAEIDFSTINRQSENYSPVIDNKGIEKAVHETRDKAQGGAPGEGGVPGTTSNIPGYLGLSGADAGSGSQQSKYDLTVDYLVNKEVKMEDLPPGAIKRRSAAVAISTTQWDEKTKAAVDQLVASAIGADVAKGDVINTQAFEFADNGSATLSSELGRQQTSQNVNRIIGWVIALLMIGLLMLFARGVVGSAMPKEGPLYAAAGIGADGTPDSLDLSDEMRVQSLDGLGANQQQQMREEIAKMIDRKPDQVAALLRSWMLED